MTIPNSLNAENLRRDGVPPASYSDYIHANAHVVSWASILVGATTIAALSLILLMLGAGLGLSSVSPWSHSGISSSSFGISTIIWIVVTQLLAAGMGGYLAGRLRTKWTGVHTDEVYFRDTAHGFMAWAVATLATVALLTSVIGTVVTGATHAGIGIKGRVASSDMSGGVPIDSRALGYFIDSLFRQDTSNTLSTKSAPADTAQDAASSSEVSRIFVHSMTTNVLPPADASYVGLLVARRTGLTQQEAENRVNAIFSSIQAKKEAAEINAKNTADKLRKATIYATLWLFISFLMGAFSASLAATWGGRSRDA